MFILGKKELFYQVGYLLAVLTMLGINSISHAQASKSDSLTAEVYINEEYKGDTPYHYRPGPSENLTIEFKNTEFDPLMIKMDMNNGGRPVIFDVQLVQGFMQAVMIDSATGSSMPLGKPVARKK